MSSGERECGNGVLARGRAWSLVVVLLPLVVYELALSAYAVGVPRGPDESPADDPETPAV